MLQLTGVSATASLAGCSQFDVPGVGSNGDDVPELETDEDPDIDPAEGVTASVQPPQEELAQLEQEVMAEAEEGMGQEEMMEEYEQRQTELFQERSVEFESEMLDDDELSLEGAIGEQGAFLIDASDERLVDTLRNGEVDALLPGEDYELVLQQAQGEPGVEPGEEPEDEDGDEDADGDDEETDEGDEDDESDDGDDGESEDGENGGSDEADDESESDADDDSE